MNSIEAVAQLEAKRQELVNFTAQQDAATAELEAIQEARNAAVRKLAAGGNNGERKTIINLEGEAAPLKLRLEGLAGLISDSQEAVNQAQADLEAARAVEAAELARAFEAQERTEAVAIIAGIPALVDRIAEAYAQVCLLVGEFGLAQVQIEALYRAGLGTTGDDLKAVEAVRMNFVPEITARLEEKGVWQLVVQGFFGLLPAWGMVKADPDYLQENPESVIDPQKYYAWTQAQARADFARRFKNQGD
jgi:seryl-tRNA synthetase